MSKGLHWYLYALVLLCTWRREAGCVSEHQPEEVEMFHLDKKAKEWTSNPPREWNALQFRFGTEGLVWVYQACTGSGRRTYLSPWMERKDAHIILLDITFAQEEEQSGQPGPLQIHLYDTDTPTTRFPNRWKVLDLQAPTLIPSSVTEMSTYFVNRTAVSLGPVRRKGFQIGFAYSSRCVLVKSVRLFYRKCPDMVADQSSFTSVGAGLANVTGSCVDGAVEVTPPVRECAVDGVWGPLQGGCICKPGHQATTHTCEACRMGFYKPANQSGGCLACPPNSRTLEEGSEACDCAPGFNRLPTDPDHLGCTKPPSAPVNVTAHIHNDSTLLLTWDPPHLRGGRQEVTYRVTCEQRAQSAGQWEACRGHVVFLSDSDPTSAIISGVNPLLDYRLSVQARNDVSTLQGAPPASTATVTIHGRVVPPPVIPDVNTSRPEPNVTPAAQKQSRFTWWVIVGAMFGALFLMAVIPITMCVARQNYAKLRTEQEVELLPMNPGVSYGRPREVEAAPRQGNVVVGVLQLLEGLSSELAESLKDVLVERNQLTLGKELGKGEFGSVYEGAFTPEAGVDLKVAVKTMRVGFHTQGDLHEFLKEAEIMKNFDHDNVVRLLGVTLDREEDSSVPVPLVILPFMKHGDLRRFLIATRYGDVPMFVPHQSLLRFMIDIAEGMDYLSSQGFLHRDLAARNCMLGDDLRVCVADFGLSKKIYSSNYYRQKVTIRVPIKWMAMESLSESVYTTKTDVWSFGVTMWEIVSRGRTPYPGVHNHELLDMLLIGHRLKPPEECDQKLYEVMQSCWDTDPSQRPGFRDLAETLKGLLSELPVLEACQEASYINQGLEAAAAYQNAQTHSEGREGNVYLPTPVGAAAARDEDAEIEDGYLKFIAGSAVQ